MLAAEMKVSQPSTMLHGTGVDYATVFGQVFLVELLRRYDVKRFEPGAPVNTALLPQEPSDGQRLQLTERPL